MTHVQPEEPVTVPAVPPVVGSTAVESTAAGRTAVGNAAVDGPAGARIVALDCYDVRFPTSLEHDGSDAMNPDPDYSAAYAVLRTDAPGLEGHALCFTIGRGNEVMVAAVAALRQHVVGKYVAEIIADLGGFSAAMIGDSQLRWLGPEKGVMHMAIGAVVNAAWDLAAKVAGKPVWRLLADMTPEQVVGAGRLPLPGGRADPRRGARHPARGAGRAGGAHRGAGAVGVPRVHHDARLDRLLRREARRAVPAGGRRRVHPDQAEGRRRHRRRRPADGPGQGGGGARASGSRSTPTSAGASPRRSRRSPRSRRGTRTGSRSRPARTRSSAWPGSARAVAPAKIAVGEHVANRVIFKQLLQAGAADVLTIDACRVAGVNENVAILLLAAKYGVAVCPHAGGVGLCEMVQHLAMFDFVGGQRDRRPTGSSSTSTTCTSTSPTRCASPAAATWRRPRPASPRRSGEQSLRDYEFPARRRLAAAGRH